MTSPDLSPSTAPRRASSGIAADQLRSIVERIERMEEEKAGNASDIKDIFAEAKGNGYDVKTLRKVIKLRAMDASERDEAEHLLHTYCVALGMQPDLFETHTEGD
jgi:uncharacterized protein (UPF0335 family)